MVSIDGMWADPAENEKNIAWVRSVGGDRLEPGGLPGTSPAWLAREPPSAGVDTAFGRNLRRLAEVKASYDPDNFFRLNNNIAPAWPAGAGANAPAPAQRSASWRWITFPSSLTTAASPDTRRWPCS